MQLVFIHKVWLQAFRVWVGFLYLSLFLSSYHPFWTNRNEGEPANLPMFHLQGIQEDKTQSKGEKGMGSLAKERKVFAGSQRIFLQWDLHLLDYCRSYFLSSYITSAPHPSLLSWVNWYADNKTMMKFRCHRNPQQRHFLCQFSAPSCMLQIIGRINLLAASWMPPLPSSASSQQKAS